MYIFAVSKDSKYTLHAEHINVKVKPSIPHWWNQWKCHWKIQKSFMFIVFCPFRIK